MEGFNTPLSLMLWCLMVKHWKFTRFSRVKILWKQTVSTEIGAIYEKLCTNCKFPKNFHTRKLVEITVFYTVVVPGNIKRPLKILKYAKNRRFHFELFNKHSLNFLSVTKNELVAYFVVRTFGYARGSSMLLRVLAFFPLGVFCACGY